MTPTDEQRAKFEAQKREVVAAAIFGNPKPRDGSALPFADQPALIRKSFLDSADRVLAALAAQEGGGERVTERWEPMETAPMDGTVIQFLQGGEVFAGFAGDDPDHPWQFLDRNGRQAFVNGFHHKFSPRWWRPLAEAPKEAALRAAQEGTGNG